MWQTVFRLEWKILRRDPAVLVTIGVFTLFLVIAALAGGRHADGIATGLQTSQAKETQRMETLNQALIRLSKDSAPAQSKDPRDPVWMGKTGAARLLILPPAPLAARYRRQPRHAAGGHGAPAPLRVAGRNALLPCEL